MHDEMEITVVSKGNDAHHIIPSNLFVNGSNVPQTFEECKMMYSITKGDGDNGTHK